mgnify:CR=1 FL=1
MIKVMPKMVLVRQDEVENKSSSGIVLTGAAEPPTTGTVIQLGIRNEDAKGKEIPWEVEVGARIVWDRHHGRTINVDGETLMLLYEGEIVGVI